MSSGMDRAIRDFIQTMQEAGKSGTSPLDTQAEILRVDEDGTAWVHIPGGVDETPVKLTINAEIGDTVQVHIGGGRAWITGNATAPPTDDKTAIIAKNLANIAGKAAQAAQATADTALKGTKENVEQMAQVVLDFNSDIEDLQNQIDGNITTWFYAVDPTNSNVPASQWIADGTENVHLGDLYYNTASGYAWRWQLVNNEYSWARIKDTDVTTALANAAAAQDTADQKRRVFYNTPTVPYDAGDLWVQGSNGDILRCAQSKTDQGSYSASDWVLASKYTDNTAFNNWVKGDFADTIAELEEGIVDAKVETYYQASDPSSSWNTTELKNQHKGDLWYNSTSSVQKYYRWSGTAWQELTATPPDDVFDSIDGKATIFTGSTTPTSPSSGDLWFKGVNEPILTYVNNSWVEYNKYTDDSMFTSFRDGTYADFVTQTGTALNGKITTYYQASAPTTSITGDLWIDTDDSNKLYRWNGSSWVNVRDSGIQQAIQAASDAQSTADRKIVTFAQKSAPTATDIGDLWIDTDDNNKMYRWSGSSWVAYSDSSSLQTWLTDTYSVDKANLQNQIDEKAETWYQETDPSKNWSVAEKPNHEGDLWYNTLSNTTWYYTGSAWSQQSIPTSIFNTISGKANIFVGSTTPTDPKNGDLWLKSASDDILTYVDNSWVKYNKYTDDGVAQAVALDLHGNYSTTEETYDSIMGAVDAVQTYTFYKYASSGTGEEFSDNDTLEYRGVAVSTKDEAPTDPRDYKWEINPTWASQVAENYIEEETSSSGFRIVSPDPATYARFTALFMAFFMNDILQMRMGYDSVNEVYGVMAHDIFALGSGAGVKFDGGTEASVRGRFVQEIRDNGHWSLKRF